MSSGGSGEVSESGWTSGDSSTDVEDIMNDYLLAASLALGIIAFVMALLSSLSLVAILYFIVRLRYDVQKLKRGGGAIHVAENGVSMPSGKNDDKLETSQKLKEFESEPSHAAPSFSHPSHMDHQLNATTSTSKPEYPLVVSTEPFNETYATIASLLPAELRTKDNLEGKPLTVEEAEALCKEEKRREESYEDVGRREEREGAAIEAARARGRGGQEGEGGRELADRETYYNPADAIEEVVPVLRSILIPKPAPQETGLEDQKPFQLGSPGTAGSYTAVFNELPPGQREVISGGKKTERPGSDLIPFSGTELQGKSRPDPAGYEDIAEDVFSSNKQGALPANTEMVALSGSLGGLSGGQRGAVLEGTRGKGREDPSKRHSMPATARRDSSKEMVEINPSSRKPVTLSSQRKKKHVEHTAQGGREGAKGEGEDEEDGGGGGGQLLDIEKKKTSDIPFKKSADDSPSKSKTFNISDESSGGGLQDGGGGHQDVYAVVDMSAKKRYRAESDAMKKEGSGMPQHYTVKEKPPESSGGQKEEVTKM